MSGRANDPRAPKSDLSDKDAAPITSMVAAAPNARYSLDEVSTEPPVVQLCREAGPAGGKSCVEIHQDVTKVFAMMQKEGFFCALPMDPSKTAIECERIEKLLERAK